MVLNKGVKRIKKSMHRKYSKYFPSFSNFDHSRAQKYEIESSEEWLNENFLLVKERLIKSRANGKYLTGPGDAILSEFFNNSITKWEEFALLIQEKTCLEVGPGPCGALCMWWWIKKAIFIDPLIFKYRDIQLRIFNDTFYTDEMKLFEKNAEILIPELVSKIDGAVICRNALDHCENPQAILHNISKYAISGCYLLLWTDLWHKYGHNEGHRNITKNKANFEADIIGLGFEILHSFENKNHYTINYGCLAIKK
jgi:hypothetical protein